VTATQAAGDEAKERARQREIASFLVAAEIPVQEWADVDHTDPTSGTPRVCTDATLVGLVRLGCLKLEADRAFLNLIDGKNQVSGRSFLRHMAGSELRPPSYAVHCR
jgi:hypothetical protein